MSSPGTAVRSARLSAFDALIRGFDNLRANWELVLVQWVQGLAVTLLFLVGLVPWLALVDLDELPGGPGSLGSWEDALGVTERLLGTELPGAGPLALALFASFAIWLVAFLVYCWFQGGIFGILWTGDRQAPVGAKDRIGFRTFSVRDVRGWGRVLAWRFFWLLNFFVALGSAWLLAPLLLAGLAYLGGRQWGTPAAIGIGCGGALPVVFGWLIVALWCNLATAAAARPDSGVWQSTKDSLRVMGRRLGACVLILGVFVIGAIFVGMFFAPLSIFLDVALADRPAAGIATSAFLSMLQWLVSGVVGVWFAATIVALVRSELVGQGMD